LSEGLDSCLVIEDKNEFGQLESNLTTEATANGSDS
jgi:hypothetical protein